MDTKTEKLKNVLRKLGFISKETEDENWFCFTYSDITFRFSIDEKQDCMTLGVAYYQEHRHVDRGKILEVMNRLNDRMNFIKVIELDDVFWLAYEFDVESRMPETEELRKMIMLLTGAYYHLVSLYEGLVSSSKDNEGDKGNEEEYVPESFDWDGFVNDEKRG